MPKTPRKYYGCYQTMETTFKKVKLVEHNDDVQMRWGSNDDTRTNLTIGKIYDVEVEVHSWHTKYFIDGKKYNSVCFEDVKVLENDS